MKVARTDRVGEQIQREISRILLEEVKDPRIGMITLSDVRVTPDLRQAKVLFTVYGEGDVKDQTLRGLRASAGFIRSRLGQALRMRHVPELIFTYDENLSHAMHMSRVLQEVHRRDAELRAEADEHPPVWSTDEATPADLEDDDDEDLEDDNDEDLEDDEDENLEDDDDEDLEDDDDENLEDDDDEDLEDDDDEDLEDEEEAPEVNVPPAASRRSPRRR